MRDLRRLVKTSALLCAVGHVSAFSPLLPLAQHGLGPSSSPTIGRGALALHSLKLCPRASRFPVLQAEGGLEDGKVGNQEAGKWQSKSRWSKGSRKHSKEGNAKVEAPEKKDDDPGQPKLTRIRLKKYSAKDFAGTSWTIAIQWRGAMNNVQVTKVAFKEDGSLVWLNKAKGTWVFRSKTRTLSFYREFFLGWNGTRIYTARLLNNHSDMYLEGDIKGWTPYKALDFMGTFQAVKRGITVDENTPRPPWEGREAPSDVPGCKPINIPVDLS